MLFSILIPAYNTEKYIAECLNSILVQSINDYEIIIADDASSDNTLAICRDFQKHYPDIIRVVSHSNNQGSLLTRCLLLKEMRGDYAVFVDSDDWLVPNALEVLRTEIKQSGSDLILFDLICKHLDGREERFYCNLDKGYIYAGDEKCKVYNKFLTSYTMNSMCTKVFKRDIIDTEQDYSEWSLLSNGDDRFQSFPIFDMAKRILYIDEALYCYRKTSGSVSTSVKPNLYDMWEILWEREDRYIDKWRISKDIIQQRLISRINEMVLIMCNKKGKERKLFYKRVREDGRLKKYLALVSKKALRLRYRLICNAVLKKCGFFANLIIAMQDVLLKMRKN